MKNKEPEVKPKINYTVTLEVLAPVTLTYQILAEDEQEALEMMERKFLSPNIITKPKLLAMKKIKAIVYLRGQSIVKKIKNYIR